MQQIDINHLAKPQEILSLHRDCSTRFGGHVIRLLMENGGDKENIALSPARLQAVLVLLANWTTPEIRKKILDMAVSEVMSLEEANILFDIANIKPLPHDYFVLRDDYGNPIPTVPAVEQQTTLWHKEDLAVNKEAVEKIKTAFNVCTKAIDFAATKAKQIIDEDVCKATHGLIEHLDTQIDASVLAMLVDVMYFKGTWEKEFDDYDTAERVFYGAKGKQKVPTMRYTRYLEYAETPTYQAVSPPRCRSSKKRSRNSKATASADDRNHKKRTKPKTLSADGENLGLLFIDSTNCT